MRLLLDNNLSPSLVTSLSTAGHDVAHVRDLGLASAPDDDVLKRAETDDRILVSADTDCGTLLARMGRFQPSVILLLLSQGRRSTQVADLLIANLPHVPKDLEAGAVVVLPGPGHASAAAARPPGH